MCMVGRAEGGRRSPDDQTEVAQNLSPEKAVKALRKADCWTRHWLCVA
jgi:hypothetical protein